MSRWYEIPLWIRDFLLSLIPWTAFAFALMLFIDAYGVGFPKTWETFAAAVCFGVGFGSRKLA